MPRSGGSRWPRGATGRPVDPSRTSRRGGFIPGRPSWLLRRLRENDLVDFTPRSPVRAYYGRRDVDVSPEEARAQARRWSERGADARAVDVGDLDHEGSVLEAASHVRDWFDAIAGPGPSAR